MKNLLITSIFTLALIFAGCEFFQPDTTELDACKAELQLKADSIAALQTQLAATTADLNKAISKIDSLQTRTAKLEFDLNTTQNQLAGCRVANDSKDQEIQLLRLSITQHVGSFNALKAQFDKTLEENYVVKITDVANWIRNIQTGINASEKSYVNLKTIEPRDENTVAAMEATKRNLLFEYGRMEVLGNVFNVQVQSGSGVDFD